MTSMNRSVFFKWKNPPTSVQQLVYVLEWLVFTAATCLLRYATLTPWSRVHIEKLIKKFPAFYGTRRFITIFTSVRHLSLSWARSIQYIPPHPTSLRFILILSSHLRLGLPCGLFPSGFPTKTLYTPLVSPHTCYFPCPSYSRFDHPHNIEWGVQIIKFLLRSFLHSTVISSLLGPNILLNTLFSNTLSLRCSLSVSDQVSHPYKTTCKIIVLYILIFKFWIANWKTKDSAPNDSKDSLTSVCS